MAHSRSDNTGEWAVPNPHDRNSTGAERLLDAVLCLLVEQGTDLLADALRPEDVTRRSGKSRSSYYRTEGFPASSNDATARRKVLEAAVERGLQASAGDLTQMLGAIDELLSSVHDHDTPREFLRAATAGNFDAYTDGIDWLQFFVPLLTLSSPSLQRSLREYYSTVTERYAVAYTTALDHLGYTLRSPFTIEQFTVALMCLADGMNARRTADTGITREFYVDLIEHLATSMLVRRGSTPPPLAPLDIPLPGRVVAPTRTEIIEAAMRLLAREGAPMPTLTELADAAGCSERTVEVYVGGVAGAIHAASQEWAPWFGESIERDRLTMIDPDPLTLLYRLAIRVAARATEQRGLTRALLVMDVGGDNTQTETTDPVTLLFEQLLLEATARGDFAAPTAKHLSADRRNVTVFASLLRSTLLKTVLTTPTPSEAGSESYARDCVDYVWAALMPPRKESAADLDIT